MDTDGYRWAWIALVGTLLWHGVAFGYGVDSTAARDLPVISRGTLRFTMELLGFRGPEGLTRLEVNLLLDAQQLSFVSEDGKRVGKMALVAAVVDTAGNRAADRTWTRSVSLEDVDEQWRGAPFRDVVRFDVKPGRYRVLLHVRDVHSEREGRCEAGLRVRDFERPGLVFSDLQLAVRLERAVGTGRFVKQGSRVVPNVSRYYVSGQPLPVYFELYNLAADSGRVEDSFILGYSLVDSSGQTVKEFPAKRYLKPGESAVKAEFLETVGLVEGTYQVRVEAYDGGRGQFVRATRMFYLVSKLEPGGLTQVQQEMLSYYADIRYVADGAALDAYNDLQDWLSRSTFLRAFWKRLDPTPGTPENERLVDHIIRMAYADARFASEPGRGGTDTDKGRVYVMYGPPDEIDYHTSAAGRKPFEVWIYERQGQYEFVFRDRRGSGVYELVHSTHPEEIHNPYWQQEF